MSAESWISIVVAVIGLTGSLFGAGGIVMHFINKKERQTEERYDKIFEALEILMKNDIVIFNAFRDNHINGESEKQEEKMKEFFLKSFIK